eukprot:TRINITY_DN9483_c0_g1_i1.p1 TRINITY_DN9483_c0_g1~~TRINITY_DN9483_c0_g1_i1.p1  ORF type:complete len:297 (-),score=81.72 TRINITY_DN9483_c0_g1_i1:130-1020(-)
MGALPTHRLFEGGAAARGVFANRLVAVATDGASGAPVAFVAMVYLPLPGVARPVLHLGLTMIAAAARGRRLQSPLFTRALSVALLNLGSPRCVVTNIGASPAGVGAVADYFLSVYPHYATAPTAAAPEAWHLAVARGVLGGYRGEFGCSAGAPFDERTFVVRGANGDAGDGGCVELRRAGGGFVSTYKVPACNAWCAGLARYGGTGDEVFQVGRVDVVATWVKYRWSGWGRVGGAPPRRDGAKVGTPGGGGGVYGPALGGQRWRSRRRRWAVAVGVWVWVGGGGGGGARLGRYRCR